MTGLHNNTEELVSDIQGGRMVILMDDEDRENEGDLVIAAENVRAEDINFMARYGRGLICLTLTRDHCRQLNLPLMKSSPGFQHNNSTNFTVSIEAARGVTTGISAADRAVTARTAASPEARPDDLVQPGHVFPLMAQPGGVLSRAGHTEAGCDLAQLAGLTPAAVIVEILNEDGTMARRADLELFARQHDIKLGTIADLIRHRIDKERTVWRKAETYINSEFGPFKLITYEDSIDKDLHLALVQGNIESEKPVLVRVHIGNPIADLTAAVGTHFGWPLRDALRRISNADSGVAVILSNQMTNSEIIHQVEELSHSKEEQNIITQQSHQRDLRMIGLGAQILTDIGVRRMRLLSAPKKFHAMSGYGLEVVEYVYN